MNLNRSNSIARREYSHLTKNFISLNPDFLCYNVGRNLKKEEVL